MSPELEYFKYFSVWRRIGAWLTGNKIKLPRQVKPRLRARFAVEYYKDHFQEVVEGSGRGISFDALRFAVEIPPQKGQEFQMKVIFPEEFGEDRSVRLQVKVLKIAKPPGRKRFRVGCEITVIEPEEKKKLMEFIYWNFAGKTI